MFDFNVSLPILPPSPRSIIFTAVKGLSSIMSGLGELVAQLCYLHSQFLFGEHQSLCSPTAPSA